MCSYIGCTPSSCLQIHATFLILFSLYICLLFGAPCPNTQNIIYVRSPTRAWGLVHGNNADQQLIMPFHRPRPFRHHRHQSPFEFFRRSLRLSASHSTVAPACARADCADRTSVPAVMPGRAGQRSRKASSTQRAPAAVASRAAL